MDEQKVSIFILIARQKKIKILQVTYRTFRSVKKWQKHLDYIEKIL